MSTLMRHRIALSGAAILASLAILAGGCGNDDDSDGGQPTERPTTVSDAGGSVPSIGSVAPNTFLTFDGKRYRLVELMQADLIDDAGFEEVGEATDADVDQEDLTVYRTSDDSDSVFTFSKGRESEEVGEDIPAFWYRWALEP